MNRRPRRSNAGVPAAFFEPAETLESDHREARRKKGKQRNWSAKSDAKKKQKRSASANAAKAGQEQAATPDRPRRDGRERSSKRAKAKLVLPDTDDAISARRGGAAAGMWCRGSGRAGGKQVNKRQLTTLLELNNPTPALISEKNACRRTTFRCRRTTRSAQNV